MKLMLLDNAIIPVILESGKRLLQKFEERIAGLQPLKKSLHLTFKSSQEIVSSADIDSQNFIISKLKKSLPGLPIYSEELEDLENLTQNHQWKILLDPLDGTHNFLFGQPQWGLSLTILNEENFPIYAYIYLPVFDIMVYTGDKQKGKCLQMRGKSENILNGGPEKKLKESIIFYDNQFYKMGKIGINLFEKLTKHSFSVRISGSSAYDIAMIAMLRADGRIWNVGQSYDILAGIAIANSLNGYMKIYARENKVFGIHGSKSIMSHNQILGEEIKNYICIDW